MVLGMKNREHSPNPQKSKTKKPDGTQIKGRSVGSSTHFGGWSIHFVGNPDMIEKNGYVPRWYISFKIIGLASHLTHKATLKQIGIQVA
jgi:hypothetical protein